jgi:uncharacterized delta-60 repeat protein
MKTRASIAAAFASLLCMANADAQPGELDATFGDAGQVTLPLFSQFTVTSPVAVDHRGRIIAGVETSDASDASPHAVFALLPNGQLDTTFGGRPRAGFSTVLPNAQAQIAGLAVDAQDRILVAAVTSQGVAAVVERLLPDGTPDVSFAQGGIAVVRMPANFTAYLGENIAVDPRGNVWIAGEAFDGTGARATVVKLDSDGHPASFGTNGLVVLNPGNNTTQAFATAVALDAAGKPLVSGAVLKQDGSIRGLIVKLTDNGMLDAMFGNNGSVEVDALAAQKLHFTEFNAVTVDGSGRIVASGPVQSDSGKASFFTTRLLADGSRDVSFTAAFGDGQTSVQPSSVNVDSAGRIVVSGTAGNRLLVYRLNSDGSPDATFASAGRREIDDASFVEFSTLTPQDDIVISAGNDDGDAVVYKLLGH